MDARRTLHHRRRLDRPRRTDERSWAFCCGEAACNGLHGANRLASNSLLEGLVFGRRAGIAAISSGSLRGDIRVVSDIRPSDKGELDLVDVRSSLRSAMWRNVGIIRTATALMMRWT